MYELVYYSDSAPDLELDDITNILKIAREFNAENNITGCLLFYQKQFVQIIEGEKVKIQELYKKIEQGKRHQDVFLLSQGVKDKRSFPNWSMAFQELTTSDFEKNLKNNVMNNFAAFADLAKKETHTIEIFWGIVKQTIDDRTP